jgi:anti-sigma-K factor RskA
MADVMTTPDHDEVRARIGAYALSALTPVETAEVQAHLAGCPECAAEVRANQAAADALAWSIEPVDPPAAIRQRVLSAVTAPAPSPRVVQRRGSWIPWLAAAASLAFAVALGADGVRLRGRVQTLEHQLAGALLQVQAGDERTTQARLVAASAERQLSVLAAPDVAHVDLKGRAAAPRASARAMWSRSRGLLFAASDLPALPAGRTYQLWIISGRAAPISNGWVFKTDASGSVTTMFDTPATLPPPTAMAVTIEPDGGTPAPTGAMTLVGSL